jgi:hypothetical protein
MHRHSRAPVALEALVGPAQVLVVPAELARALVEQAAGLAGLVEPVEQDSNRF